MTNEKKRKPAAKAGLTKPRQFRLGEDTLAELDYLQGRFGLMTRSDVIRYMARRMAQDERRKEG